MKLERFQSLTELTMRNLILVSYMHIFTLRSNAAYRE